MTTIIKYLTILVLLFFLTGCSDNDSKTTYKNLSQSDSLKQAFLPIIKGVWANADYINDVQKTKSPFKSSDKINGIDFFQIKGVAADDTLFIPSSLNNHEGFSFTLFFESGKSTNSLKTDIPDYETKENFFDLGYECNNADTFLFLYHFDKSNKLLSKKKYSKIRSDVAENDNAYGLQYVVNDKLISGTYTFADTNSTNNVTFDADGSLSGFSNYKTYFIQTDFGTGIENNIDNIYFYRDERDSDRMAYKISKDTLKIFEIISADTLGIEIDFGKLKYKLVRQER